MNTDGRTLLMILVLIILVIATYFVASYFHVLDMTLGVGLGLILAAFVLGIFKLLKVPL